MVEQSCGHALIKTFQLYEREMRTSDGSKQACFSFELLLVCCCVIEALSVVIEENKRMESAAPNYKEEMEISWMSTGIVLCEECLVLT